MYFSRLVPLRATRSESVPSLNCSPARNVHESKTSFAPKISKKENINMEYQIKYENGIANRGCLYRLKKVMDRAKAGEALNIAFLGGSITQGSLSSKPELCYAYHVYEWWKKTFPQADLLTSMQESAEQPHSLVWRAQKLICFPKSRILSSSSFPSTMTARSTLWRPMRDWCEKYIPVRQNRQFF